jgi:hypothetical protein
MSCREKFANATGMNHHWMAMHRGVDTKPFRAPADDDPSPEIPRHAFPGEPLPDNKPNWRGCKSK